MKPIERLIAAGMGEMVDRQPIVIWAAGPDHRCDGIVIPPELVKEAIATHPDQAILAEIMNPYGRGARRGTLLNDLLHEDPKAGEAELESLKKETESEINSCLADGAHGIFYRLDGAYPEATTPMQYGGHFLEVDRELLTAAKAMAGITILYVEGEDEVYIDFISDLPASALSWYLGRNKVTLESAKKVWNGPMCVADASAEIILARGFENADLWVERIATGTSHG